MIPTTDRSSVQVPNPSATSLEVVVRAVALPMPGVSKPVRTKAHLWTPAFATLLTAGAGFGFAFSCFHLLPKYLVTQLAGGPVDIGAVAAVFGVSSVLSAPLIGVAIDAAERKPFLLTGIALLVVASIGFTFVDQIGPLLYALRLVQGLGFALAMTVFPALVAEIAPRERIGEALGLSGASMLVMNAVAPAIAEPVSVAFGWSSVFVMSASVGMAALAITTQVPESYRGGAANGGVRELLSVVSQAAPRACALAIGLCGVAFGAMFNFLAPYALASGTHAVSGFFVAYAVAAGSIRLVLGGLTDRVGPHRVSVMAFGLYCLVVGAAGRVGPDHLIAVGLVFGLAHGVFFPSVTALALLRVGENERGRVMALLIGAFGAGAFLASSGLGVIADRAGYPAVFTVAAWLALLGTGLLAREPSLADAPGGKAG